MPPSDIISVIVPIYNVQKYLDACVKSIVSQTYQQLEIILVDDGSPDQCGEICDAWAKKDERIAVYHKENGGLSDARNYGIERAHGKYVTFVDSDDVIAPDFISYLHDLLRANGADAACCDCVQFEGDPCPFPETTQESVRIVDGRQACGELMDPPLLRVEAWSKMYRSDIVKQYLFPVGRIHEDVATVFKFLYSSKLVAVATRKLYGYRQRPDSIMGIVCQKTEMVNSDLVWCMRHRAKWYEDHGEKTLSAIAWNDFFNHILAYDACSSPHRHSELLWEIARHCMRCKIMSPKQYLKLFAYYITPRALRAYYRKKFKKEWRKMRGDAVRRVKDRIKKVLPIGMRRAIRRCMRVMYFACYYTKCRLTIHARKGVDPVIIFETPSHGNMGDHAITYAEELLVKRSRRNFWIEIPDQFISGRFFSPSKWRGLARDHKVFVSGGGFVGSLWIGQDMAVREILKAYSDHEIVFFPQTVYFDDKSDGLINEYRELFRRCKKVTFMVREKNSYQRMLQYDFPNVAVKLMPDMVTYLKPADFAKLENCTRESKKALLCMRKDHERILTDPQRARIDAALRGYAIGETDTVVPYRISSRTRKKELEKKLAEFADADLIVTDRLHGMVLAAIAQTPCVAFNNCSDKVRGLYEWIKENRYIQFIDDIDDLEAKVAEVTGQPDRTYHNECLQSYFEELAEYL